MRRLAIVAYDIASNRRRRAVLRVLARWRLEGQKSVHECRLDPEEAAELYLQLRELIDPDNDHLLLVWSPDAAPTASLGLAAKAQRGPLLGLR
jgi:CRISPR-associated protein Cas2